MATLSQYYIWESLFHFYSDRPNNNDVPASRFCPFAPLDGLPANNVPIFFKYPTALKALKDLSAMTMNKFSIDCALPFDLSEINVLWEFEEPSFNQG